jgi:uncharacterized membrane protein YeaQ/YmgE (transglycosylase-associated protein family)
VNYIVFSSISILGAIALFGVGTAIGCFASEVRRDDRSGFLLNNIAAVVGAFSSDILVMPLVGGVPLAYGEAGILQILIAGFGAIELLMIMKLARRLIVSDV